MPAGIPVATLAIGKPGAINAALFAVAILAAKHPRYGAELKKYRDEQAKAILAAPDPRQ
jgi:5-(carboxyamino)imidazole ribonucleotide mutase